MTEIINEGWFQYLVKFRKFLIITFIFIFIGVAGASYFINGRTYKSGIEFYIFKPAFEDSKTENTIFLNKEEIEIIKSIATSEQLFLSVINSQNLLKYYNKKFSYEAVEILREATIITIDEHCKISVQVEDLDKYVAFTLSGELMKKVNELYNQYAKNIQKTQCSSFDQQIQHYTIEKQNIDKALSKYPIASLNLKFSDDSLTGPNYIKRINLLSRQTGLKIRDVTQIINLFHRLDLVENQIYVFTDQKQRLLSSIFMLGKNHIFITNKSIHFRHTIESYYHLNLALKFATISIVILIGLMLLYKSYKKELILMLRKKES